MLPPDERGPVELLEDWRKGGTYRRYDIQSPDGHPSGKGFEVTLWEWDPTDWECVGFEHEAALDLRTACLRALELFRDRAAGIIPRAEDLL